MMSQPSCADLNDADLNERAVLFSVVIATRNRPMLLARALASVCGQTYENIEVIVVDDGSDPEFLDAYASVIEQARGKATLYRLPVKQHGHGPSHARNHAVNHASGRYLAFIDDDDEWIDTNYLSHVARICDGGAQPFDLHLANQEAVLPGGGIAAAAIWLEDLGETLPGFVRSDRGMRFPVSPAQLLRCGGFCHLNTTVVRRAFFLGIGGFDTCIRYEEDRDFYLRAIDAAARIVHSPRIVSRHYIPDPNARSTASTAADVDRRALDQLYLLNKCILSARHKVVRKHGRRHKAYTIKNMVMRRLAGGDHEAAFFLGIDALSIGFTFRWLAFVAWMGLRHMSARRQVTLQGR